VDHVQPSEQPEPLTPLILPTRGTVRRDFEPTPKVTEHFFGAEPPRLPSLEALAAADIGTYDAAIAYVTAVASAWAYADGQTLSDKLVTYGVPGNTVRQISVVNDALLVVATAQFVLSHDGTTALLVFRGTEPMNIVNWLTNFEATTRPFPGGGNVHSGFYRNVEALWDRVTDAIAGASALESLYVAGHSMGGAMAVLAAARLFTPQYAAWQPLVRGVYTFGQPMVGDAAFKERFGGVLGELLYTHVYRRDLVPHMPPRSVGGGFRSFGSERFAAHTDDGWSLGPDPRRVLFGAWAWASAAVSYGLGRLAVGRWFPLPYSIEDHSPFWYVDTSRSAIRQ
jgi:hypothetical protein